MLQNRKVIALSVVLPPLFYHGVDILHVTSAVFTSLYRESPRDAEGREQGSKTGYSKGYEVGSKIYFFNPSK